MELSPDGRYFMYLSDETGQNEVYVQTFPFSENRWNVSHREGIDPIWSFNGDEIYYRTVNTWYSVRIDTQNGFKASRPALKFGGNYVDISGKSFAVSPDGERFLVLEQVNQEPFSDVIVFVIIGLKL
jgi:Tol biopolymer transport system component